MAGLIEPQYEDYFNAVIKPHLDGKQVEYLGLLSQSELAPVYRKAAGDHRRGRTGFVVDSVDEGVAAVDKLPSISPAACRRNIETRFSVVQMGRGYQAVYESVHADRGPRAR